MSIKAVKIMLGLTKLPFKHIYSCEKHFSHYAFQSKLVLIYIYLSISFKCSQNVYPFLRAKLNWESMFDAKKKKKQLILLVPIKAMPFGAAIKIMSDSKLNFEIVSKNWWEFSILCRNMLC